MKEELDGINPFEKKTKKRKFKNVDEKLVIVLIQEKLKW